MATPRRTRVPPALAAAASSLRPVAVPLLVIGGALALRLAGLGQPDRLYFDEVYYVEDARALLRQGVEDGFAVHPPVGKWLIAAGIALVGDSPLGWRAAPALAGTLLVGAVYLLANRLLRSRGAALLAALLVAVDGVAITMSRIAMLDIFLALFIVVGALLLRIDGERRQRHGGALGATWARWPAGGVLGLAVATKWSGVLALAAACLIVLAGDLLRTRRRGERLLARPLPLVGGVLLPLVVLPAAVYLASYTAWFASFEQTRPGQRACESAPCEAGPGARLAGWGDEQRRIARFHWGLEADHAYRAPATTWPAMTRPVVSYFESCGGDREASAAPCEVAPGTAALILVVANPVMWWSALAAYPALLWAAARQRDGPAAWILVLLLGQFLPWLVAGRPVFFFYTTPLVPFVALALAWVVARLPAERGRAAGWALALAALAAAAFWYPVWMGAELPDGAWRARMLLSSWY